MNSSLRLLWGAWGSTTGEESLPVHIPFSYLFSKTRQWSLRRRSPSCEDTLHNVVGIMQKWIWLWYEWQLTDAIFFYTGFASLDVVHHGVWNNVFDADGWGNCMFQWGKKVIITKNVTMVLIRLNAPSNTLTLHCLKSLWKVVSVIMRFNQASSIARPKSTVYAVCFFFSSAQQNAARLPCP